MTLPELAEEVAHRRRIGREEGRDVRERRDEPRDELQPMESIGLGGRNPIAAPRQVGVDPLVDRAVRPDAHEGERQRREADDERALDDEQASAQGLEGHSLTMILGGVFRPFGMCRSRTHREPSILDDTNRPAGLARRLPASGGMHDTVNAPTTPAAGRAVSDGGRAV